MIRGVGQAEMVILTRAGRFFVLFEKALWMAF
jgi:hypothetical protein